MTWSFPPANVVQDLGAEWSSNNTEAPAPSTDFLVCSGGFHCATGVDREGGTPLLIAETLAVLLDVYDWYTMALHVDVPATAQGSTFCQVPPLAICPGDDFASSSGSVNCGLVRQDDGTAVATSGGASADGLTAGAWEIGNPSLSVVERSLVVNPSPSYPVPDGLGNTSGAVLWRRSELLAMDGSLAFTWSFYGKHVNSNIGVQILIDAYNETSDTEGPVGTITKGPTVSGVVRRKTHA